MGVVAKRSILATVYLLFNGKCSTSWFLEHKMADVIDGRVIAQAVSRCLPKPAARVQTRA
jgi:hypothetical protein